MSGAGAPAVPVARRIGLADGREVSAILTRGCASRALLVLGHGAGTRLDHPFMDALSGALNASGIATLRFNYPYSERGGGMARESVRLETVRAAAAEAARAAPDLALGAAYARGYLAAAKAPHRRSLAALWKEFSKLPALSA